MTTTHEIALIPGDGIGARSSPPACASSRRSGQRHGLAFAWSEYDWGCDRYARTGRMMPADGLDQMRSRTTRSSSARSAGPACPTTCRSGAC